jgi:hypothetical protein
MPSQRLCFIDRRCRREIAAVPDAFAAIAARQSHGLHV